jgi:sarcosine oxidase subunit beta
VTGWAGLYETSPDETAILGKAQSAMGQVFEAHSFSGHGVMQSYAGGLALAELMVGGRFETVDLSEFSGARFQEGRLVHETQVI